MTGDQGAQVCGVLTTYYLLVDLNVALRWSGHHLSCVREPMRRSHNRLCVCVCVAATVLPCRPAPPMILEGCVVVLLGYVIDLARRTPPPSTGVADLLRAFSSCSSCSSSSLPPPPPPPCSRGSLRRWLSAFMASSSSLRANSARCCARTRVLSASSW